MSGFWVGCVVRLRAQGGAGGEGQEREEESSLLPPPLKNAHRSLSQQQQHTPCTSFARPPALKTTTPTTNRNDARAEPDGARADWGSVARIISLFLLEPPPFIAPAPSRVGTSPLHPRAPRDRARDPASNPRARASGALTAPRAGANPSRRSRSRADEKNRTTPTR